MFEVQQISAADKKDFYEMTLKQVKALIEGEKDKIANLANISALLNQVLDQINWVGFYLIKDNELVLGPFQGKVACVRIQVGRGVCGTAVSENTTQVVKDVHLFPGHIACDSASNSEIVVPIRQNGQIVGVLDIDSPIKERFDEVDAYYMEKLVQILEEGSNW